MTREEWWNKNKNESNHYFCLLISYIILSIMGEWSTLYQL